MATHTDPGSEGWISRIIEAAIHNRFLVIFFVLLMGVFGVRSARQLPIDAVPDVTNVQVQVLTSSPRQNRLQLIWAGEPALGRPDLGGASPGGSRPSQ